MEDNHTNEYASISLNRRDGPLVETLANKLSIVANSSTNYKTSSSGNHDVEEQEQFSPILAGAWGFLPSPTGNDESSSQTQVKKISRSSD